MVFPVVKPILERERDPRVLGWRTLAGGPPGPDGFVTDHLRGAWNIHWWIGGTGPGPPHSDASRRVRNRALWDRSKGHFGEMRITRERGGWGGARAGGY